MKRKKMGRVLALCLAAAMLLGLIPASAAATQFTDVPDDSWFAQPVAALSRQGLIKGVSDTSFDPDGAMTRAMVVTILFRMNGSVSVPPTSSFTDVPADAWFAPAVAWADRCAVTEGMGDGTFAPMQPVTREQFAAFLWRYAAMRYEPDFSQYYAEEAFLPDDPVSDWAEDAMRLSIGAHVIQGRGDGENIRWAAGENCTRAEAAMMLLRFLNLELTDRAPAVLPEETLNPLAQQSLDLFRAMYAPGENTVTSPLSAICALAMLYNGAADETKAQLESFFGCTAPELDETLSALLASFPNDFVKVRTANSMWLRRDLTVKPEFLRLNQDKLGAETYRRSFNGAALREINSWVSRKTDGMIPSILDEFPDEAMLILINALLCEGKWQQEYSGTTPMDFHAANGKVQKADMLCSTEDIYLHDNHAEGFLKPLLGGRYAFAVLLPEEGMTPAEYLQTLDGASLRVLLRGERYDEVHTAMPQFKTAFQCDLNNAFTAVGLTDLTHLDGVDGILASSARHKAVIDVNKDGVSAAAVTSIAMAGSAMPNPPKKIATVIADRPYLYMIVDTAASLPLFLGVTESVA